MRSKARKQFDHKALRKICKFGEIGVFIHH